MIVVDSSAWIDWFRSGSDDLAGQTWRGIDPLHIIIGDVVLLELLRGARSDAHARQINDELKPFRLELMVGQEIAVAAARYYRQLRSLGITIRSSVDLIIGAYCIHHGHSLMQNDRDFLPMAKHLGLQLL